MHCLTNNFKLDVDDRGEEDNFIDINTHNNTKNYVKLYENTMKFFKNFIYTRNPTTVTWLLEILYILSAKFKPDDNKLEKKIKQDYHDVLDTLLKSATQIIQDTFGIKKYHETYGIDALALSPTIYEMVKRYEFLKNKHPSEVEKALIEYKR